MESLTGGEDDIDDFYKRHRQQLFTYALSITCCSEAAEDAIQDAFCRIYRKQHIEGDMKVRIRDGQGFLLCRIRADFTNEGLAVELD